VINRAFYRFHEVLERLGTDTETLRQAVVTQKVSVFLELAAEDADLIWGDEKGLTATDPYCWWRVRRTSIPNQDSEPNSGAPSCRPRYVLSGWFRLDADDATSVARLGSLTFDMYVAPSCANADDERPSPQFSVTRSFDELFVESAWFLATQIDELTEPDALKPTKWPWGDHETRLLRDLAAAAREWWSTYDPEKPGTAPTNDEVMRWLITERGVADRNAKVIATMLRADDLKDGRRPRR
jgi:hypothetical protein